MLFCDPPGGGFDIRNLASDDDDECVALVFIPEVNGFDSAARLFHEVDRTPRLDRLDEMLLTVLVYSRDAPVGLAIAVVSKSFVDPESEFDS